MYCSIVSWVLIINSLARKYAFFFDDFCGSTMFIKMMSNNWVETLSDSVINGDKTSSINDFTLPLCSSLKNKYQQFYSVLGSNIIYEPDDCTYFTIRKNRLNKLQKIVCESSISKHILNDLTYAKFSSK